MRIWYCMSADGLGHAMRSSCIIDELKKNNHDITISCADPSFKYMSKKYKKVYKSEQAYFKYEDNSSKIIKSFGKLVLSLPKKGIKNLRIAKKIIKKEKPDLIISDFEPLGSYAGLLFNIPCLSIDNNHEMLHSDFKLFPKYFWIRFAIKMWYPRANHYIITSFDNRNNTKKITYINPVLRREIYRIKAKKKNYGLVYQTSKTNTKIIPILEESGIKFKVYGMKNEKRKNIEFKKFDEKGFLNDLKDANFVVTNGGFNVITEAIFLKKPIFSIPIKNQAEQEFNSILVDRLGYGISKEKFTKKNFKEFISKKETIRKNMKKVDWKIEKNMKIIEKTIEDLVSKSQI